MPHPAGAALAVFLGAQVHGGSPHAGQAERHAKGPDGGDELEQSQPRRADHTGEIDLKTHGNAAQEKVNGRQKQGIAKNRVLWKQKNTSLSILWTRRRVYAEIT